MALESPRKIYNAGNLALPQEEWEYGGVSIQLPQSARTEINTN